MSMNKTKFAADARKYVHQYVERELEARGEALVYPTINIILDHDPEGEWDGVNNAIILSRDERTGNIHIYLMTCIMHKQAIERMFDTKIQDYVGHVVVDSEELSKKYLPLVRNFSLEAIRELKEKMNAEAKAKAEAIKTRFPGWDNL